MKSLGIVLASVIVFSSDAFFLSAYSEESNSMMMQNGMGYTNMCQSMIIVSPKRCYN